MSMSKKDFQAIAAAIYDYRCELYDCGVVSHRTLDPLVDKLADEFAQGNPRFDRARFLEACETGSCKGMPKRKEVA